MVSCDSQYGDNDDDDGMEIESDEDLAYVEADQLDDEDDIPVSYQNALILNEVSSSLSKVEVVSQ